jgi:hypothetical protein
MTRPRHNIRKKVVSFVTVALQKLLAAFQSTLFVLVCETARYPSCRNFTVSQLFNNEANTFLGYSNMVCDTLLSDSPVILNQIVYEFAMIIVCVSDRTSAACFINNYGFSRLATRKFYYPSIYSIPINSIVTINNL